MAGFPMRARQAIVDGYLNATDRDLFIPAEFIDWLEGQPKHEAYPWFFGKDDAEAAREYRIDLARRMVSGLRITVSYSAPSEGKAIRVTTREYPSFISEMAGRMGGGGYRSFDATDPAALAEMQRQAASALRGWLGRYRGAAEAGGVDLAPLEAIAVALDGEREADAA